MKTLPNQSQILKMLTLAKKMITDPSHWGKGSYARDKNGRTVATSGLEAVKWCAVGALESACSTLEGNVYSYPAEDMLSDCIPSGMRSVTVYNDNTTHKKVMAMFQCAIDHARKAVIE